MTDKQSRWLVAGFALVTVLVYARVVTYGFVYEDRHVLPTTDVDWRFASSTEWMFVRGAMAVSFRLTPVPWMAHAVNLMCHLGIGILVWSLARRVLSPSSSALAWIAPTIFWLHPLQVEAVAYLQGRSDQFIAAGTLVALWAITQSGSVRWWHGLLAVVGVVMALWTKEMGFVAIACVAWTVWWRQPRRLGWASLVVVIAVLVVSFWAVHRQEGAILHHAWLSGVSPWIFAGWSSVAWWEMVVLGTVWPFRLSVIYDVETLGVPWLLLALGALAALMFWVWRRRLTVVGWAVGLALLSVLPRFALRLEEVMHEKHLYLAVAALAIAVPAAMARGQEDAP